MTKRLVALLLAVGLSAAANAAPRTVLGELFSADG